MQDVQFLNNWTYCSFLFSWSVNSRLVARVLLVPGDLFKSMMGNVRALPRNVEMNWMFCSLLLEFFCMLYNKLHLKYSLHHRFINIKTWFTDRTNGCKWILTAWCHIRWLSEVYYKQSVTKYMSVTIICFNLTNKVF